ncbi:MAG: hypothetical protein M4D80_12495 [Myxococcota bacterium]|nr:hypothetical protein [Deltaproteobacteria bacterium]MDQ3335980.1 hypothetical protein [Myxococcota bacterium]
MRILPLVFLLLAACGGSSRSTFARHPGAPLVYDRASAKPEAIEFAEKVIAAHGGVAAWDNAKQIRWKQAVEIDGKKVTSGSHAWDRWNARHWAELDRDDGNNAGVMYEIYGEYSSGYILAKSGSKQPVPPAEVRQANTFARAAWQRDTTILAAPFLLLEPGSKLELLGEIKDDTSGALYTELKVTFDPKDTARAGVILHVYVDKTTFAVGRIELEIGADRFAYTLSNFQTVGGLKFATERKNIGSGEVVKVTELKVGGVDDDLYMTPIYGPA